VIRINLLPKEMQKTPQVAPKGLSTILGIFLIASVLSSLYAVRLAQVHRAEQELLRLEEEIAYWSPYLPKNVDLQAALKQAKEEYAEVSVLDEENLPFWVLLARTSDLIDESTWIESFAITADGRVSIKGSALSYASVSDTLGNFRNDALFGSPQLASAYVFEVAQANDLYAVGFEMTASAKRRAD
jgi:Tfp pilus assembly protein PilN